MLKHQFFMFLSGGNGSSNETSSRFVVAGDERSHYISSFSYIFFQKLKKNFAIKTFLEYILLEEIGNFWPKIRNFKMLQKCRGLTDRTQIWYEGFLSTTSQIEGVIGGSGKKVFFLTDPNIHRLAASSFSRPTYKYFGWRLTC